MKRGFTLIELLIVVAIIAILAAIAVPNFLEAQTRSKVSRAKADMRSTATAIESYAVDNNKYPMHGYFPDDFMANVLAGASQQTLHKWITSPIAYLSSDSAMREAFTDKNTGTTPIEIWVNQHINYACFQAPWATPASQSFATRTYGVWRLASAGPDRKYFKDAANNFKVVSYDATNGTISVGDIMRSAKAPDFIFP